ncbi:alcohol dehydrogenase [Blastopirellula marina]|uniref:Alcohol dehydrogenase n=1 Tax=Blastopirellula marina TaxID=124 RepID=A0A2S8G3M6_9BACT|nr:MULTISPECIES: iron-containing alcohol dehydrogenase [Pirellulaceae]PQO39048.1 alcohol dehydrogenase [Blastopirellula marina]RCS55356.1 iron-containing alcohol dehydrogenase [Bremerella cremea]
MIPFDFQPRTRIVFGPDSLQRLGELAIELGAKRALVVSDPGVIHAGHTQRGIECLESAGVEAFLFDGVQENPSTENVARGVAFAQQHQPELIVGLGGGSAMDCAKGINFLLTNGGEMKDYWGVGKATQEMLPMIAVPTTAGTGSEAQSFALITDAQTHVKMACGDKKAACRIALLDPKLTVTQPQKVTALTGIDAISHALETFVTKKRNEVSLSFSREAWRLLAGNFTRVLSNPEDVEARGAMQLGACFAGLAIENSMLGAAHALANPLTAHYGVVHGQAVGVMLPSVIRYNGEAFNELYQDLLSIPVDLPNYPSPDQGAEGLANLVQSWVDAAGLATNLNQLSINGEKLDTLSADAAKQWTGHFNPRDVDADEFSKLYRSALQ